jgi:DNA-binding beta-propeller fold protein YncE
MEELETRVLLSASVMQGGPDLAASLEAAAKAHGAKHSVVGALATVTPLTVSTIPSNGDLNPYGLAFVPEGFPSGGALQPGDLLVSNFNDGAPNNQQGTGTTITLVSPNGHTSTFFQGSSGLGLTTALGILKKGFVIVGNLPTMDGTSATAQPGSLLVLDKNGNKVAGFTDSQMIDGPWDLAIDDDGSHASVFISNVLNGTVSRLNLNVSSSGVSMQSLTQIASGFMFKPDPIALELGPTGLAFDEQTGQLFVASTEDNKIFAISNAERRNTDAGTGKVIYQDTVHLHGPLGMVLAPNGDLIFANGDALNSDAAQPSTLVEITHRGKFVSQFSIDTAEDAPFGIAIASDEGQVRFAAVDDNNNMVSIWTIGKEHGMEMRF